MRAPAPFDLASPEPRRLRESAGLTQAEMASLVGSASYRTWQAWETRQNAMPVAVWELVLLKTGRHPTLRLVAAQ